MDKSEIDMRNIVERDLGKPHSRTGKYNIYRCPMHRETKGYSFAVYNDHAYCYGKCNKSWDVIAWMQDYHGITYHEVKRALGLDSSGYRRQQPKRRPAPRPAVTRPAVTLDNDQPPNDWQLYADKVIHHAVKNLWSDVGSRARDYLNKQRGLPNGYILSAKLGYIPATTDSDYKYGRVLHDKWLKSDGNPVRVPVGITIPHICDGNIWNIRVRRPVGDPKYMGVPGGKKCLYGYDDIQPGQALMIVEGEFDALTLAHVAPYIMSYVALASASNKYINRRWHSALLQVPRVYVRMDFDAAGVAAVDALQRLMPGRVLPVQVPGGHKDINDFCLADGADAVGEWIDNLLGEKQS